MSSYADICSLYVSEKGSDSNTGISPVNDNGCNGPVATVEHALRLIAEMRRIELWQPITVYLMDEEYDFEQTLQISFPETESYGSPAVAHHITFAPYMRERVLFSGGRRLTGFKPDTFNGQNCLSLFLPDVKNGQWNFTDLYVNGNRADLTRFPEDGYLVPEDVENHNTALLSGSGSRWITVKKGDIPAFRHLENAMISYTHYWIDEHSPIESYNSETRKLTMAYESCFTVSPEAGTFARMDYYLENIGEMFRHPGEWYLERETGKLYYLPKPGETADNILVYAPVVEKLVTVQGKPRENKLAEGIRFCNIDFAYTKSDYHSPGKSYASGQVINRLDGEESVGAIPCAADCQSCCNLHGAVNFIGACDSSLENCHICCSGSNGVVIGNGSHHVRIEHCLIENGGGGGVRISGGGADAPEETRTHDCRVADCTLRNLGLRYAASDGVLITDAYRNEICHNEIHDLNYSGIAVGWVWGYLNNVSRENRIMKNHIYRIGKGVLSDMGGIYILGMQPGTLISGNVIHDVVCKHYGGSGIYTDEGSSFLTIENNICYRLSSDGYCHHYGSRNTVRNNVFALARQSCLRSGRDEAHLEMSLEHNIFYQKGGSIFSGSPTPCNFASDRNILFDPTSDMPILLERFHADGTTTKYTLDEYRRVFGNDLHSITEDPRFRDPENGDFTLSCDSPAFKLGFVPIRTDDVGPRK